MKIAYTVCTLNRLGQVLVLGNSLLQYNPDYIFIVGLADELNGRIDPTQYGNFKFIPLSEINIPDQGKLTSQYDAFELSCALKPYFGTYILKEYNPDYLFYFDTDMCIYNSLSVLEDALQTHSILLTPHYVTPLPDDGKYPLERDVLNAGLYNGGFIGLKNSPHAAAFLHWWKERLYDQGYNNVCEGMMVDQLWLNLAPLFFEEVLILKHPGCNIAYWNLHERVLSFDANKYFVNEQPLVFFHFSGYKMESPGKMSVHQNRYTLTGNNSLKKLFSEYHTVLEENRFQYYLPLEAVYGKKKPVKQHSLVKRLMMNIFAAVGYKLEKTRKI
jgi:hypothetical protein